MKTFGIFILLIFLYTSTKCQITISSEEIAFIHLTRLIKNDTTFKMLKFKATRKIYDYTLFDLDTMFCKVKSAEQIIKNPLGENILISDKRIKKIRIPVDFKNHKEYKPVRIFQHFKCGNYYYVFMNFQDTSSSGYNLTMILNSNGDLLTKCLSKWIQ